MKILALMCLALTLQGMATSIKDIPPVRIEAVCETCDSALKSTLDSALAQRVKAHGLRLAVPGKPAPEIRAFALTDDSTWTLSYVLNSPGGTMLQLGRHQFGTNLAEVYTGGFDSMVVDAKRVFIDAIERSRQKKK
ncbi:MAG: hypothetical protein H6686_02460 [Fibrobacteria bacterium]|nr:hypothetical protein [Fibrobacteria bacterium]